MRSPAPLPAISISLAMGSFLNVCIDRLPVGESIARRSSRCASCDRPLSVLDLVSLLNYLWSRGRCRYCRAAIPMRLSIVELVAALLSGFLFWVYGLGPQLAFALFYTSLLLVIVSQVLASKLLSELRAEHPQEPQRDAVALSQREAEVLHEIAKGASNKVMAASLFITENTVKAHLRNAIEKLYLTNRSQAAVHNGGKAGLLRPERPPAPSYRHLQD